ncbi:MAG: preprotein translocase subunit SecE [Buchnera aphidicola (Eriosoma harunire)]
MNDNTRNKNDNTKSEFIKWSSLIILLIATIVINTYYLYFNILIYILCITCISIIILNIFFSTKKGAILYSSIKKTKEEIQKIIWPSYKDTLYTTLIVSIVTTVMSLILWLLDKTLLYLVTLITSMRL